LQVRIIVREPVTSNCSGIWGNVCMYNWYSI